MMLLILMLLATNYRATESVGLDVIGNVQGAYNFFNDAVGVFKGDLPISALLTGSTGVMLDRIMDSVGEISNKIDNLSATFTAQIRMLDIKNARRFDAIEAAIDKVMTEIPKKGKLNEDMREFRAYTTRVNTLYEEFEYYSKNKTNFNELTINYFIEAVISRNRGDLYDVLRQMYHLIIQEDWYYTEGIMQLYARSIRETSDEILCGAGLSPQGRFFKMYETIYMAEAHGLMMQMFAFSIKSAYTRTSFIEELELSKTMMLTRIEKYYYIAMNQMEGLSLTVELCDAPKYVSGIDYVQIGELASRYTTDYFPNKSIALIPKIANVDENMVVAGIRFVKRKDGLIDYQIKEAKLLPHGQISPYGAWKELPEINPKNPDDFWLIEEGAALYTNDIIFDPEYVIVGVRGKGDSREDSYTKFHFIWCGMKFDAETGQLEPRSEKWVPDLEDLTFREKIWHSDENRIMGRSPPYRAEENHIDSIPHQKNRFASVHDLLDTMAAPFFDARPVEMSLPNFPLRGMGIYHRGSRFTSGYFNFRLYTMDVADYMKKHGEIVDTT